MAEHDITQTTIASHGQMSERRANEDITLNLKVDLHIVIENFIDKDIGNTRHVEAVADLIMMIYMSYVTQKPCPSFTHMPQDMKNFADYIVIAIKRLIDASPRTWDGILHVNYVVNNLFIEKHLGHILTKSMAKWYKENTEQIADCKEMIAALTTQLSSQKAQYEKMLSALTTQLSSQKAQYEKMLSALITKLSSKEYDDKKEQRSRSAGNLTYMGRKVTDTALEEEKKEEIKRPLGSLKNKELLPKLT